MSENKMLILVDFSYWLHKFYYGFKDHFITRGTEKIFKGSVLGFTLLAERLTDRYPEAKIVFCMDGTCTKKQLNENYKANRDRKDQIHVDTSDIVNLLSQVPKIYFAKSQYHEADDLIANLAFKYNNNFEEIIIYSGDKDFWQLSDEFKIANDYEKGFKFVTPNNVFEKFGVSINSLLTFRVLDGDSSDNLKSPVPYTSKEFRRLLAEMWNPSTEEHLVNCLELLKGTQWNQQAIKHLEAKDKIMNNLQIMDLKKYKSEENRFNYNMFRHNNPDRNLVNYYELKQYEGFLYDCHREIK